MLSGNSSTLKQIVFFFFFFGYVAVNAQDLEEEIYQAVDEFSLNKTDKSLKKLTQKQTVFEKRIATKKEKLALVILLCNKAFYLKSINKSAVKTYEKAWKLFSNNKLSNYDIIEYCLKPLGNLYIKNKDYTNAENIIKHYIFLGEQNENTQHQIGGMINLSILYQSIGNHKKVVALADELLSKKEITSVQKNDIRKIKADSLLFLDESVDDIKINENYYKYKQFLTKGDYKQAFYHLNKSINNSKENELSNRDKAKQYLEKAQLLFLLNDTVSSIKTIKNGLEILLQNKELKEENLYAEPFFTDAFDLLAELKSDAFEKLEYYDLAFYVANLLAVNVTSQQAKVIHQNDNRKRSEKCIAILFELYRNTKEKQYFERALQYAETYKSGVVSEKMKKQKLLRKYPNDTLLLKENQLLIQQEQLTNSLIVEQTKLSSKASKISDLSRQLNQISVELKKVQDKVTKKYKREMLARASLEEITQKLKEKKASLMNYFYGKNAIYQFLIRENKVEFNQIELSNEVRNDIVDFIRFFDEASIINNNVQDYTEKAYKIYKTLNVDALENQKNILIIPDGLLNFVPFEAILTSKTSELSYSKMPFLVRKSQIIYNVNISSLVQEKSNNKKENVLGFFPVFSNTNKELKYSLDEANAIKKYKNIEILSKEKATKQHFTSLSNNYDVLHLSTHAQGGGFSEVPTVDFFDETLTLNELYGLNLNSNLAILSACETGVGVSAKGEGVLSISRGFQYAGVPNVLFSLWSINDKSTSVLMEFFYKELEKSNSVNFANQQSKISYLQNENIENSKKSPYYWGAFVYYGIFEEVEEQTTSKYVFLSLLIPILILVMFLKKRL